MEYRFTLREILRRAVAGDLPEGWLYLPVSDAPTLDTVCLLLDETDEEYDEEQDIPPAAVRQGFPHEGLDSQTITANAQWAKQLVDPPPDELLLEAYLYYCRFDSCLPAPGAPPPPPWEEAKKRRDRQFYESLGEERAGTSCREPGCERGAVHLSVFCRVHHFESVRRERCPFTD